jgi:DNA-binding protein HU-beta
MNKAELVDAIVEKAEVSKKHADAVLNATLETIMEMISGEEKVTLMGFGSFEQRQAREGRNPQIGKTVKIPAKKVPVFSAGKAFKDQVVG